MLRLIVYISILVNFIYANNININGTWILDSKKYPDFYGDISIKNGEATINVSDNQIYIIADIVNDTSSPNSFNLKFISSDIGRGGMNIPWDKVSKNDFIGNIKVINPKQIIFQWNGLKNKDTKKSIPIFITSFPIKNQNSQQIIVKMFKDPDSTFETEKEFFISNKHSYTVDFNKHGAVLKESQNPDKTEWLYLGNKCDAFSKVHGKGTWKFDDYEKGTFTIRFNDKTTFPFDNLSDRFWKNNLPNQAQECK